MVGPPTLIADAWARHDYTVLAPNIIGDFLAVHALAARDVLQSRVRAIVAANWPVLEDRLQRVNARLGDRLQWRAPRAGAIAFVRYDHAIASDALAEGLRDGWSVLIAPGDHFGLPKHVRIGIGGAPAEYKRRVGTLEEGLLSLLG
jgi:hypothetical protein